MNKLIFAIILILLLGCAAAQQQTTPNLTELATLTETFTGNELVVGIENAYNVGGYQADISYDASSLRFVEISFGNFLGRGSVETFKVSPKTDVPGLIKAVAEARTGNKPGVNGNGTLFTAKFEKISVANGWAKITYFKVVDTKGKEIQVEMKQQPIKGENPQVVPYVGSDLIIMVAIAIVAIIGAWLLMSRNGKQ